MSWSLRFRVREYVRGSLWIVPLVGGLVGVALSIGIRELEDAVDVPDALEYSPATATTLLAAIVGAMAALTGFVITVTVLVVQMATGTFSARYMRLWYRDRVLKTTLALLIGTLTLAFTLLRQIDRGYVPNLGIAVAGGAVVSGLLLFLVFFDRFVHRLRPVAVAALAAEAGRHTFQEAVRVRTQPDAPEFAHGEIAIEGAPALVVSSTEAGAIQAIDGQGLVRWARKSSCTVVLPHAVGDFVPTGGHLFRVHGAVASPAQAERELRGLIALGDERTIQQDPAFAIRIMVDIAIRGLSPAVNDPTTAVQVLDQLAETLRLIGTTKLVISTVRPRPSEHRVVIRARSWDDFLALSVTEIRVYGVSSVQVLRRLRALLTELAATVLPENRAAVEDELARLDATVRERWAGEIDFDRVSFPDGQGMGGPSALPSRASPNRGDGRP